jgi:hypothetical protein
MAVNSAGTLAARATVTEDPMLVGYMRASKADGSQTTDLQKDALVAAGVEEGRIYEDHASGAKDDRPGLAQCLNLSEASARGIHATSVAVEERSSTSVVLTLRSNPSKMHA